MVNITTRLTTQKIVLIWNISDQNDFAYLRKFYAKYGMANSKFYVNWLNFLEILRKLRGKTIKKSTETETEKATKSNRSKQILRKIILR